MHVFSSIDETREFVRAQKKAGRSLGVVPTMGALHQGHLSLVKLARARANSTVVSIFINPSQFNDPKDFDRYPRTLERDLELLAPYGVSAVFAPTDPQEMYGADFESWIALEKLPLRFEGASRPGHFRGVSTVVAMLFNLISPSVAVFGEKDFQQLRIIEQMVRDLKFDLEIIRAPIMREEGGLAMSSRNVRLSDAGRSAARAINRGLSIAFEAFKGGRRDSRFLRDLVLQAYASEPAIAVDYIAIVDESSLEEIEKIVSPARVLVAVMIEGVRLIDNWALTP